jgi:PAS domain S-box-containing protein
MIEKRKNKAHKVDEEPIYREIVEAVNSIILRWDGDLRVTFINRFALEFFGYTRDEILGKSLIGTIVPATSAAGSDLVAMIRDIASHPERYIGSEIENVRHDGTRVWVSWTNRAIMDKQGNVREIISVGNDITDRKRAEEALQWQLKMTGTLLDAIPIPVFYKNAAGIYTGCNRAFAAFLGKPKDEIIGRTVYDVAPPDLADIYRRADDELMRHKGKQIYETSVVAADGTRHDVLFNKATYLNEDGTVGGIIGTILDITKRKKVERDLVKAREELEMRVLERTKELEEANRSLRREIAEHERAEERLRESEEKFRALAETSDAPITIFRDGENIYVNRAAARVTGRTIEELMKIGPIETIHPDDRVKALESIMMLERGEKTRGRLEIRILRKDGSVRWIDVSAAPISFHGKNALISIALDITERKRADEELKKAKARAELYLDLMGHDIINMNQAMMGYLEMAHDLLDLKGHEELIERPMEILRHSSRLIASVKKLEQAQSGKYPLRAVDLGHVIKEVADEHAKVPGRDVRINYPLLEGRCVQANDFLKDVFGNLVDNAIRHSEGPLDVNITVEPVREGGRMYYRVSVADNGPGISDDMKRRIFRIVDVATGTPGRRGLGLFMVRTLVQSYNGRVWVEDRVPGDYRKGSRFVVLLPAAGQTAR